MSDIKVIIGAEIKELEQKLAVAKAKLADFGQQGPRLLAPLQQRLSGLTFPTKGLENFASKFSSIGGALKAFGVIAAAATAGIAIAKGALSKWLEIVKKDFVSVGNAAAETAKKIKDYKDIVDSAIVSTAKESTEIIGLLSVLNNETETRKRKLDAIKELQKIQPYIFDGLKLEGEAVIGLDEAYKSYLVNLRSVIAAKIIQAQIEAKVTELLKIQGAANTKEQQAQLDNLKNLINTSEALSAVKKGLQDTKLAGGFLTDKQTAVRVASLNDEIKGLFEKLTEFSKTIKVKEIKVKPEKIKIEKPDRLPDLGSIDGLNQLITDEVPLSGITLTPQVLVAPEIKFIDNPAGELNLEKWLKQIKLKEFQRDATEAIQSAINNIVNDSISTMATALGEAMAGNKDALPNLFGNIVQGIGGQLKELGKYLVQIGLMREGIYKAIKALNISGVGAIAIGIAAQVLGALLISSANKKASQTGFASGTTGVGQGGFYEVGERGRERIFLPQGAKVQPNNEVNAYGGGQQVFIPAITLQGPDLVIAFNRAQQQMGRNN